MSERFLPYLLRLDIVVQRKRWRLIGYLPASSCAAAARLAKIIPGGQCRRAQVVLEGAALLWFMHHEAPGLAPLVEAVVRAGPGKGHRWTPDLAKRQDEAVLALAEEWHRRRVARPHSSEWPLPKTDEYRPAREPPPRPAPRQEI